MKLCLQCGFLTRNPDMVCDDCRNETDKRFRVKARYIGRDVRRKEYRDEMEARASR